MEFIPNTILKAESRSKNINKSIEENTKTNTQSKMKISHNLAIILVVVVLCIDYCKAVPVAIDAAKSNGSVLSRQKRTLRDEDGGLLCRDEVVDKKSCMEVGKNLYCRIVKETKRVCED